MSLFLLKAPEDLLDIMKDLQSCMDKAQEKKAKKKKKKKKQGEASCTMTTSSFLIIKLHLKMICLKSD